MTNAIAASIDRKTFFLGVNTGYVSAGLPDRRYVDFYERRASRRLHCAIIGNVVVPGGYGSNESTPVLSRDDVWATVAGVIGEKGCLPGIQLASAWEGYVGNRRFVGGNSDQVIGEARQLVSSLGPNGIEDSLRAFGSAAQMAVDHGFRHVQFHAAHGYLLSLLIDRRINPDAERVLERLSSIASSLSASSIECSIRISLRSGDTKFDAVGRDVFYDQVVAMPFDYFDLSSGFYNIDKKLIYPSRLEIRNDRISDSCFVASAYPKRNFIVSGLSGHRKDYELPPNLHIGLCRDLIANPDFMETPNEGCQNRSKCHYFSRGEVHITCGLWEEKRHSLGPSAKLPAHS